MSTVTDTPIRFQVAAALDLMHLMPEQYAAKKSQPGQTSLFGESGPGARSSAKQSKLWGKEQEQQHPRDESGKWTAGQHSEHAEAATKKAAEQHDKSGGKGDDTKRLHMEAAEAHGKAAVAHREERNADKAAEHEGSAERHRTLAQKAGETTSKPDPNESDMDRSYREWGENWFNATGDPEGTTNQNIIRAIGYGEKVERGYRDKGQTEKADGFRAEVDNFKRILREREQAKAKPKQSPTKPATAAESKAKEPWEMSEAEFENVGLIQRPNTEDWREVGRDVMAKGPSENDSAHKRAVRKAIAAGKIASHPDYPELNPKAAEEGTTDDEKAGNERIVNAIERQSSKIADMQQQLKRDALKGKLKPATDIEKQMSQTTPHMLPYERYVQGIRAAEGHDFPMNKATREMHRQHVQEAINSGATVSPEVLAEYPGIKPKAEKRPAGESKTKQTSSETTAERRANSPLRKKIDAMKAKHPGKVVAMRMGDFYEFFGEDAEKAAKAAGLTLTRRGELAMAGFPYHQKDAYLEKMKAAGLDVADEDMNADANDNPAPSAPTAPEPRPNGEPTAAIDKTAKTVNDAGLDDQKLYGRQGHQFENIQKALGVKKPITGPKGLSNIRKALAAHPGGKVIEALLGVDGSQTSYTDSGFADRGGDAFRKAVDGKFSKEELKAASDWMAQAFSSIGPVDDANAWRFIRGNVQTARPKGESKPDQYSVAANLPIRYQVAAALELAEMGFTVERYAHDVSQEARDKSGQWTAGSSQSGSESPSAEQPDNRKISRARHTIDFEKPVTGPSGAKLTSYEWKYYVEKEVDERGEDVTRRYSDWDEAADSGHTGRQIVHHFHIKTPDGKTQVVSLESALQIMGYTPQSSGAKQVKSLSSAVKTRAKSQMALDRMESASKELSEAVDKARSEVAKLPAPQITEEPTGWGKAGDWDVWMRHGKHQQRVTVSASPDSHGFQQRQGEQRDYGRKQVLRSWRIEQIAERVPQDVIKEAEEAFGIKANRHDEAMGLSDFGREIDAAKKRITRLDARIAEIGQYGQHENYSAAFSAIISQDYTREVYAALGMTEAEIERYRQAGEVQQAAVRPPMRKPVSMPKPPSAPHAGAAQAALPHPASGKTWTAEDEAKHPREHGHFAKKGTAEAAEPGPVTAELVVKHPHPTVDKPMRFETSKGPIEIAKHEKGWARREPGQDWIDVEPEHHARLQKAVENQFGKSEHAAGQAELPSATEAKRHVARFKNEESLNRQAHKIVLDRIRNSQLGLRHGSRAWRNEYDRQIGKVREALHKQRHAKATHAIDALEKGHGDHATLDHAARLAEHRQQVAADLLKRDPANEQGKQLAASAKALQGHVERHRATHDAGAKSLRESLGEYKPPAEYKSPWHGTGQQGRPSAPGSKDDPWRLPKYTPEPLKPTEPKPQGQATPAPKPPQPAPQPKPPAPKPKPELTSAQMLDNAITDAIGEDPEAQKEFRKVLDQVHGEHAAEINAENDQLRQLMGQFGIRGREQAQFAIDAKKAEDWRSFQEQGKKAGRTRPIDLMAQMIDSSPSTYGRLLKSWGGESAGKEDTAELLFNRLKQGGLKSVPAKHDPKVIKAAKDFWDAHYGRDAGVDEREGGAPAEPVEDIPFSAAASGVQPELYAAIKDAIERYTHDVSAEPRDETGEWAAGPSKASSVKSTKRKGGRLNAKPAQAMPRTVEQADSASSNSEVQDPQGGPKATSRLESSDKARTRAANDDNGGRKVLTKESAVPAVADLQAKYGRHVDAFIDSKGDHVRKMLTDSGWSKGECETVARELSEYLTANGIPSHVIGVTGFQKALPDDAHPEWKSFVGGDISNNQYLWHAVARTDDAIIDITGSQYGKQFGGIRILPPKEFAKEWRSAKTHPSLRERESGVAPKPVTFSASGVLADIERYSFDPKQHPRGQPENKGEFAPKDGQGKSQSEEPAKPVKPHVTETPEFKRWFGQSKVVDNDGKPLRVFHGTASRAIEQFLPDGGKDGGRDTLEMYRKAVEQNARFGYMNFRSGSFFSPDPDYAANYTAEGTGAMYPVYIKAENPIYFDAATKKVTGVDPNRTPDALIMTEDGRINEIAVIDPSQVKSATGNRGSFDPEDPRINYSAAHSPGIKYEIMAALELQQEGLILEQYAARKSQAGQGTFHWITIGSEKDNGGGVHVAIDANKNIVAGPEGLEGKKLGELGKEKSSEKQSSGTRQSADSGISLDAGSTSPPDKPKERKMETKRLATRHDRRSGFPGYRVGQMVSDKAGRNFVVTEVHKPEFISDGQFEGMKHAVTVRPATEDELAAHDAAMNREAMSRPIHEELKPVADDGYRDPLTVALDEWKQTRERLLAHTGKTGKFDHAGIDYAVIKANEKQLRAITKMPVDILAKANDEIIGNEKGMLERVNKFLAGIPEGGAARQHSHPTSAEPKPEPEKAATLDRPWVVEQSKTSGRWILKNTRTGDYADDSFATEMDAIKDAQESNDRAEQIAADMRESTARAKAKQAAIAAIMPNRMLSNGPDR